MKTIKCESCSNEISPKAATCPKCGYPNKKAASSKPQEPNQDEDLRAALLEGLRDDGYRD